AWREGQHRSRQRRNHSEPVRLSNVLTACCQVLLKLGHDPDLCGSGQSRPTSAPTSGTKPMTTRLGTNVPLRSTIAPIGGCKTANTTHEADPHSPRHSAVFRGEISCDRAKNIGSPPIVAA